MTFFMLVSMTAIPLQLKPFCLPSSIPNDCGYSTKALVILFMRQSLNYTTHHNIFEEKDTYKNPLNIKKQMKTHIAFILQEN